MTTKKFLTKNANLLIGVTMLGAASYLFAGAYGLAAVLFFFGLAQIL